MPLEYFKAFIDGWAEYWNNNKHMIRSKPTKSATKNTVLDVMIDETCENIIISDISNNTP